MLTAQSRPKLSVCIKAVRYTPRLCALQKAQQPFTYKKKREVAKHWNMWLTHTSYLVVHERNERQPDPSAREDHCSVSIAAMHLNVIAHDAVAL